jgi:glutamate 5-kinase
VVIASGDEPDALLRLARGEALGTRFPPRASAPESRQRWLLAGYTTAGRVVVDAGAMQALRQRGSSLLPIGVADVLGDFQRGDTIGVFTPAGREIARGLVRYPADDVRRIARHHSDDIEAILGYTYGPTVIHRNDLVLL